MFKNVFKNKKVLITGHTGFKGSWLSTWLLKLGAEVIGISKDIPTNPSMFVLLNLKDKIKKDYRADIRNLDIIEEIFLNEKPDFVFHLAAQPIVSVSYKDPIETITSNVMGTTNILEILRKAEHECTAIIITSDKAYDNIEQVWGYRENDALGGKDIYSGSKGAAELIIKSYCNSFFKEIKNIRIGVARAGNVIGGGDWAKDRIVVDSMMAWSKNKAVNIRSPKSTRPWQHVLEPLSGYLNLAMALSLDDSLNRECFNFGPRAEQNHSVAELLVDLGKIWSLKNIYNVVDEIIFDEAKLLKLNCDKALHYLKWHASLEYKETIEFTSQWYYDFYKKNSDMFKKTTEQIIEYENLAKSRALSWTE